MQIHQNQFTEIYDISLEGGWGGPRSIFTFLLFLIEKNGSNQELFSELKNIVPSPGAYPGF